MKYVGTQNIKRLCNFYASELHLAIMLLPYLSRQLNGDVEITTIFEKLKKEEIAPILEKLNLENKNEILNINWLNSNVDTNKKIMKSIEKGMKNNKDTIIIISGNIEYISNNNYEILKWLHSKNILNAVKIIDCYNIDEVGRKMKSIVKEYDGIINTSGEIGIQGFALHDSYNWNSQ